MSDQGRVIAKILQAELIASKDPEDRSTARRVDFASEDAADLAQEIWESSSPGLRYCGVLDMHDEETGAVSRLFYELSK